MSNFAGTELFLALGVGVGVIGVLLSGFPAWGPPAWLGSAGAGVALVLLEGSLAKRAVPRRAPIYLPCAAFALAAMPTAFTTPDAGRDGILAGLCFGLLLGVRFFGRER